jgi:hypothetical protein
LRIKWEYNEVVRQLLEFKKAYDSVRKEVLYNIVIEFGIPMNLVRIIKMCLKEMYSRVRVGKNLCDTFPIRIVLKQRDVFSPLIFNFALEYAIRRVHAIKDGFILNGTHQLPVCVDDVNIMGGSVHTLKGNAEILIVASKEIVI